jgi:hypothetical protein
LRAAALDVRISGLIKGHACNLFVVTASLVTCLALELREACGSLKIFNLVVTGDRNSSFRSLTFQAFPPNMKFGGAKCDHASGIL